MKPLSLIATLVLGASLSVADKPVRQPTMADLARVWIGREPRSTLIFFRLELNTEGVGLLTVQYLPDQQAAAYRVSKTSLSKYQVAFVLSPVDEGAEPLYLRGEAIPGLLSLEVGYPKKGGLKTDILLKDEQGFMARLKAVTDRASDERNRK